MSREILEAMTALAREKGIAPEKLHGGARGRAAVGLQEAARRGEVRAGRARPRDGRLRVIELPIPEDLEAQLHRRDDRRGAPTSTRRRASASSPQNPRSTRPSSRSTATRSTSSDVTPDDFGRIAAQTAKQVILQRIREAERDMMFEEYRDRVGELITGIVQQSDSRYTLVQLRERVEALLPKGEQVDGERYDHGQRIKAVIKEVSASTKGPSIIVSRRDPELIKSLFELEVPEIADGLVEIANVAREPGYRSKIAVVSHADGVDPVGACVGPRGSRVRMVVSELRGEKIDIIPYNDEPARFVAKALSPARVREVLVDDEAAQATVIVPDDQLSLAIGREGQNARLAARLTGWRIDIKSETEFAAVEQAAEDYEEETGGRCQAVLVRGPPLPERRAARLAVLRPAHAPGAVALHHQRGGDPRAAHRPGDQRPGRPGHDVGRRRGDRHPGGGAVRAAGRRGARGRGRRLRRRPARGRRRAAGGRGGRRGDRGRGAGAGARGLGARRRPRPRRGRGADVVTAAPHRRCIGCGTVRPKADLLRLVAGDDGNVVADPAARAPGRGAMCAARPAPTGRSGAAPSGAR